MYRKLIKLERSICNILAETLLRKTREACRVKVTVDKGKGSWENWVSLNTEFQGDIKSFSEFDPFKMFISIITSVYYFCIVKHAHNEQQGEEPECDKGTF